MKRADKALIKAMGTIDKEQMIAKTGVDLVRFKQNNWHAPYSRLKVIHPILVCLSEMANSSFARPSE